MNRSRQQLYWPTAAIVYWLCALWLLISISPISFDGAGPTATFYQGSHRLNPTLTEYGDSRNIRLQFLYSYWLAASIITLIGLGSASLLLRLLKPSPLSRLFIASASATLLSLLGVAGICDIAVARRVWSGPTMYAGFSHSLPFLEIIVPMSLLAGLLALVGDRTNDAPSMPLT